MARIERMSRYLLTRIIRPAACSAGSNRQRTSPAAGLGQRCCAFATTSAAECFIPLPALLNTASSTKRYQR